MSRNLRLWPLVLVLGGCDGVGILAGGTARVLLLRASGHAEVGLATVLTVEVPESLGAERVEIIDQALGEDLLVAVPASVALDRWVASWKPEVDDEGGFQLRAKVLRDASPAILSDPVPVVVAAPALLAWHGFPPPADLTAIPAPDRIALGWAPVEGATGYHVFRGSSAGFSADPSSQLAEVAGTTFEDLKAQPGVAYRYRVSAFKAFRRAGKVREGELSVEVQAMIGDSCAPSVSITSPAADQTLSAAQTVQLVAAAEDNVGVARVEFYDGTALVGTDSTAPFTHAWSITAADNGAHAWTARAYDSAGLSAVSLARVLTVAIQVADSTPPTVTLTAPAADTVYTSAQTVILSATAADNVGVAKLEIYDGATLRATLGSPPFSHAWSVTAAANGDHLFTAKAYDAAGLSAVSAARKLTVAIPTLPAAPIGIQAIAADGAVTVTWSAVAGATGYELYFATTAGVSKATGTKLAPAQSPYAHTGLLNGTTYHYVVAAVSSAGSGPASAPVSATPKAVAPVDTTPPTVSISAPAADTTYTSAQTVTVTAAASDNVGITKVELYDGPTLRSTLTGVPFSTSFAISAAANGVHSWTAKAYDAAGLSATSTPRILTVTIGVTPGEDLTPPTFTGLGNASAKSDRQVLLTWPLANDNVAAASQIVYDIYQSTTGTVSYTAPSHTTGPGASAHQVSELVPGTSYTFAVRARDLRGNRDGNLVTRSVVTLAAAPAAPVQPFASVQGGTAAGFSILDCKDAPFSLHGVFGKHTAVVLLFNDDFG